jgi:hypothetical protein
MSQSKESIIQTLAVIKQGIDSLLDPNFIPPKMTVDCVAFSGTPVDGGYEYPTCLHPDRGGPTYGCLLVVGGFSGNACQRIPGQSCNYQIRRHQKGEAALKRRIKLAEEGDSPL